jgi:hypothetical protein
MRRIEDPMALREYLSRLSSGPLTPAQARMVLAARGVRARRKVVEAALKMPAPPSLDELPLTQEERRVMERLRKGWR